MAICMYAVSVRYLLQTHHHVSNQRLDEIKPKTRRDETRRGWGEVTREGFGRFVHIDGTRVNSTVVPFFGEGTHLMSRSKHATQQFSIAIRYFTTNESGNCDWTCVEMYNRTYRMALTTVTTKDPNAMDPKLHVMSL